MPTHPLDAPFLRPRVIASGFDVPVVDPREDPMRPRAIQLLRTAGAPVGLLERHGARRVDGGWRIARSADFPFAPLAAFLPRVAQASVTPDVVDLIPAASWFASLANMLVGSSWDALRLPVIEHARGCQDCGSWSHLEAHEFWSYDPATSIQSLIGIRSLCQRCHEMQHLGRANVTGRFPAAFDRLCRVNRLRDDERAGYREAVFDKFLERSERLWDLDLSAAIAAAPEGLFLKAGIEFGGDGWVFQPAGASRDEISARLVGVDILTDGRRLVLVPPAT